MSPSPSIFRGLFAVILTLITAADAAAQELGYLTCKPPTYELAFPQAAAEVAPTLRLKDLKPTGGERFGSALALNLEIVDQPDFVAVNETIPSRRDPDVELSVVRLRPARDSALGKGTVTLNLAAFFDNVDEINARYTAINKHRKLFDLSGEDPVAVQGNAFRFFARTRARDRWGRFLSGLLLSGALAQRAEPATGPPLPRDDEHEGTFKLSFDPAGLFVTGEQLGKAVASLTAYAKAYDNPKVLGALPACPPADDICLRKLAGMPAGRQLWTAIIPKLEIKSVDQFDFFQVGSRFATSSILEETIETVTLTWDLKRAFGVAGQRRAAVASLAAIRALKKNLVSDLPSIKPVDFKFSAAPYQLVYLKLEVEHAIGSVAWQIARLSKDRGCQMSEKGEVFPGISFDGNRLVGYPKIAGTCEFGLRVADEVGRQSPGHLCALTIPQAEAETK